MTLCLPLYKLLKHDIDLKWDGKAFMVTLIL